MMMDGHQGLWRIYIKCFDLAECRKMTVDEACDKMGIGRTTYYRYWHKVKSAPQRERHTELFEELQAKIEANELSISAACRQMNIGAGNVLQNEGSV